MAADRKAGALPLQEAFEKSALFAGMDAAGSGAFLREFHRGETISAVQDGAPCVGVLAFGEADVYTRGASPGARQNVSTLHAGSEFGIGGGRVSKLEIVDAESGKVAASYDRGWDVRPGTAIEYAALSAVLDLFE